MRHVPLQRQRRAGRRDRRVAEKYIKERQCREQHEPDNHTENELSHADSMLVRRAPADPFDGSRPQSRSVKLTLMLRSILLLPLTTLAAAQPQLQPQFPHREGAYT